MPLRFCKNQVQIDTLDYQIAVGQHLSIISSFYRVYALVRYDYFILKVGTRLQFFSMELFFLLFRKKMFILYVV